MRTIRKQDLQSLAVVYDMEPDALTAMLLHAGVLTIQPASARPATASDRKAPTDDRSDGQGTAAPGDAHRG